MIPSPLRCDRIKRIGYGTYRWYETWGQVNAERHARAVRDRPDEVDLLDVLHSYVVRKRGTSPAASAERTALRQMTLFCQRHGVETVGDFSLPMQERFVDERYETLLKRRGKASSATINRDLEVVRAALNDAWKRNVLDRKVHVIMLPKPPPRQRFLKVEEVRRLLAECHEPHLRRFVILMLHTVQRPGAILDLEIEQVDLEAGLIDFLPSDRTQSSKRRPVVPITRTLESELERAIRESRSGYVVEYLGRPITRIRTSFEKAAKRAGLKGVSPYTVRHTGATLMAARGVPMRQIAGFLGHTTQRVTEMYAKHSPEFLMEAKDALEELFGEDITETGPTESRRRGADAPHTGVFGTSDHTN